MGIVYKAWHEPLARIVAVKMILSGAHASERQQARFQHEAESVAKLTHPNIVSVYEVGKHNELPFFSLEYVSGDSMSRVLRESLPSADRAIDWACQVADAIHYSHGQGIVHRDLKPQNILITDEGVPKVTDFGLAKRLWDEEQEQTQTGEILGTPGYMAPEQARGEKSVGPLADVYALGAVLYYLLTGRAPFVGPTPVETVRQVLAEEPLPPSRLQPKLNRDLETICLKCLQKEPGKRYQSAKHVADELRRVREGTPILARRITRAQRVWKWCRRNPKVATLGGVAATLLFVLLFGGYIAAGVINHQMIAENEARELAETNESIAKENEALAEDQAELALDATRVVLYETQKFFRFRPELNELRKSMLDGILPEIERVYTSEQGPDIKGIFRASTLRQLGQIFFEAGVYEQALARFEQSEEIARRLHWQGRLSRPDLNLGTLDLWIGDTQLKLGNLDVAEKRYHSMIEHRQRHLASQRGVRPAIVEQSMAEAYGRLGEVYRLQGKLKQAQPLLQRALDARRAWYESNPRDLKTGEELSGALGSISSLYEQTGDFEEMVAASQQALQLLRRSVANKQDFPTFFNLAVALRRLGRQYQLVGEFDKAETHLRESVEHYEKALESSPEFGLAQAQAADSYYMLAKILFQRGEDHTPPASRGMELCDASLAKSRSVANRVMKMKLVALSGDVDQAIELADALAGKRTSAYFCLCAAVGYALASDHCEPEQQGHLLDEALDCVRAAVLDLGFREFVVLQTDPDFSTLQKLEAYQQLLESAVSDPVPPRSGDE